MKLSLEQGEQGELTSTIPSHGPPVGVYTGPMVTLVQPIVTVHGRPAAMALLSLPQPPGLYIPLFVSF